MRRWLFETGSDDLAPPIGQEIVVWRHSYMLPGLDRTSLATDWEILGQFEPAIRTALQSTDPEFRKICSEYFQSGGQICMRGSPEWLVTQMEIEVDSSIISVKTIRDIVQYVTDRKPYVSGDEVWTRLSEFLMQELGVVPAELNIDRPIECEFSTSVKLLL